MMMMMLRKNDITLLKGRHSLDYIIILKFLKNMWDVRAKRKETLHNDGIYKCVVAYVCVCVRARREIKKVDNLIM